MPSIWVWSISSLSVFALSYTFIVTIKTMRLRNWNRHQFQVSHYFTLKEISCIFSSLNKQIDFKETRWGRPALHWKPTIFTRRNGFGFVFKKTCFLHIVIRNKISFLKHILVKFIFVRNNILLHPPPPTLYPSICLCWLLLIEINIWSNKIIRNMFEITTSTSVLRYANYNIHPLEWNVGSLSFYNLWWLSHTMLPKYTIAPSTGNTLNYGLTNYKFWIAI